jgi:Transposase DDE domain group 1
MMTHTAQAPGRATAERGASVPCHFTYQAGSWSKPRWVIAKVEWHPGELYPRVGSRPAERVVAFYNKRGTCEQWIKEGKGAIKWTRLSSARLPRYPLQAILR